MSDLLLLSKQAVEVAEKSIAVAKEVRRIAMMQMSQTGGADVVDPLIVSLTVFMLACFVGYYVVWKVTPALHTPLMSVTNAISGIVLMGTLVAMTTPTLSFASILGFFGSLIASINVFGGFMVTKRMLEMFRKK